MNNKNASMANQSQLCLGQHGFTLIDLMIAVSMAAILATIAYASYSSQIKKSRRVNAQSDLSELTQYMERYYTNKNSYVDPTTGAAPTLPFTQSPQNGASKYYDLTLAATSSTYTLTATPNTTGNQNTDTCGTLTITDTGAKAASTGATGCWP